MQDQIVFPDPSARLASIPVTNDVIEYTIACALALSPPEIRKQMRDYIATHAGNQARRVFGGQRNYVAARPPSVRKQVIQNIRAQFNGLNIKEVMEKEGVSRKTVYRAIQPQGHSI